MNAQDRKRADALARDWIAQGLDLNEAGKVLAHLRTHRDWEKALKLMDRLNQTGAVRSQQTRRYYRVLHDTCARHIGKTTDAQIAAEIFGWAFRLAKYHNINSTARQSRDWRRDR